MIHCMAHAPPANRWKLAVMQNFKSLHTVMIKYKPSQWKTKTKVWWSEHQYYLRKLQILSDSSFGVGGKGQPSLEREEELEREERALDAVWLMALDSVALSQLRTLRLRLCLDGCSRWWAVQTCRRNASRTFPTCCWMLDLVLTRYPKNWTPILPTSGPQIMKRTAKHIGWPTEQWKAFQNKYWKPRKPVFGFPIAM